MADKRLPKERTFTSEDVAQAHAEGKVYDPTLVDFVPVELPVELLKAHDEQVIDMFIDELAKSGRL